jgi:hypothetical protein
MLVAGLVQDLLPHLPDFTEIDLFKDQICKTLEDCRYFAASLSVFMGCHH